MQRLGKRAAAKEAPAADECTWRMQIQRWNRRKEGTAVETSPTKRWKRAEGDLEKSQVPGVGWNAMFTRQAGMEVAGWCLVVGWGDGQETIRLQIADCRLQMQVRGSMLFSRGALGLEELWQPRVLPAPSKGCSACIWMPSSARAPKHAGALPKVLLLHLGSSIHRLELSPTSILHQNAAEWPAGPRAVHLPADSAYVPYIPTYHNGGQTGIHPPPSTAVKWPDASLKTIGRRVGPY